MRCLLLSSLLGITLLCGCSRKASQGDLPLVLAFAEIAVFEDTTASYLYKSKINLYGHYLSGLMMIKPKGNNDYKVAMTTEFGAKILDFEITDGKFKLNDCIEQMKRKRILAMLEADMKMLLGIQHTTPTMHKTDTTAVFTYSGKPYKTVYAIRRDEVITIDGYKGNRPSVHIDLKNYVAKVPKTLVLEHFGMPVHIEMNLIKAPGYAAE